MAEQQATRRDSRQLRESSTVTTDTNNAIEWSDAGNQPVLPAFHLPYHRLSIEATSGTDVGWTIEGRNDQSSDTSTYTQIASGTVSGNSYSEGVFAGDVDYDHIIVTVDDDSCNVQLTQTIDPEVDIDDSTAISTSDTGTHAEDSAHTSGDDGALQLGVRNDTLASLVDADGDYAPVQVGPDGGVYIDTSGQALSDFATDATTPGNRAPQVGEPLVTEGAHETLTPAAGASATLDPSTAGITTAGCHATVENTGTEIMWLNFNGTDGDGHELKPDESVTVPYLDSTDGIMQVVTDGAAGGAGEAHCTYEGF